MNEQPDQWYSVKCLFHHPTRAEVGEAYLYEERITVWKASSFEEAEEKATVEAEKYAAEADAISVGPTDTFHLFPDRLEEGTEVYSLMRGSNFDPDSYQNTFCITGRERIS